MLILLGACLISNAVASEEQASSCIGCHQAEHSQWQQSDHQRSMLLPAKPTVLAPFQEETVNHHDTTATFRQKGEQYWISLTEPASSALQTPVSVDYQIQYTFGHFPLQQYLVETDSGKLQVLPFSWDSRPEQEGGQRWFANYSEKIPKSDRLHWLQPLQNWNGMCADCHSQGLKRAYEPLQNAFNTTFNTVNVGCLSCHTMPDKHGEIVPALVKAKPINSLTHNRLSSSDMSDCLSCHALRTPLTDGFKQGEAFLNQFTPQLLNAQFYYPDGQIKEEVFVYGSFLQSKMYQAGVTCSNCHDTHSGKVKQQGNGLCLQCHQATTFDTVKHHQHPQNSAGALCVNCHMPESTFMQVDNRRDHSFKIPRPELSMQFDTPNACVKCHTGMSNEWAKTALDKWHPERRKLPANDISLIAFQAMQYVAPESLEKALLDESIAAITRASSIALLDFKLLDISDALIRKFIAHNEPLIRLSAIYGLTNASSEKKMQYLKPLLKDKFKAIRLAAAKQLAGLVDQTSLEADVKTFEELNDYFLVNSWRADGRAEWANFLIDSGELEKAAYQLEQAIKIDPFLDASYVNLASLLRVTENDLKSLELLNRGLSNIPDSGPLVYVKAMTLIRLNRIDEALSELTKAYQIDAYNSSYLYAYALLLDQTGQSQKALNIVGRRVKDFGRDVQLLELGLYLAQKNQDAENFRMFKRMLN